MNPDRDYLQKLRKVELEVVHLQISGDLSPEAKKIVNLVQTVEYKDGSYHTYYGDIKKLINVFLTFWNDKMDEAVKEADKICKTITKDELLDLIEKNIDLQKGKQIDFSRDFLPIKVNEEKCVLEEIETCHYYYVQTLMEMRDKVESFDKPHWSLEFVQQQMPKTLKRTQEIFEFTHKYIALFLTGQIYQLRQSLEENVMRVRNNLSQLKNECEDTLNALLDELYEVNKQQLILYRKERRPTVDMIEIDRKINAVKSKIESKCKEHALRQLQTELGYWERNIEEFETITKVIKKLKAEMDSIAEQIAVYNSLKCKELPGSKNRCWKIMGDNFYKHADFLRSKFEDAAQVLMTHFGIRGSDQRLYNDETGQFYIDEYNHQVYQFEHGLRAYHVTCDGQFKVAETRDIHYTDDFGRYILKDGEKVYQRGPCSSSYRLDENNLMVKTTLDCGHSSRAEGQKACGIEMVDETKCQLLPDTALIDIKNTLSPDVVRYLWDVLGHVLPFALRDVGNAQPRNPLHYFAHRLLANKYGQTRQQLRAKQQEAEDYRSNILKQRKEKAIASCKAWKSKQVKRRKPEESDDTETRAVYQAQMDAMEAINQLDYFFI